MKKIIIIAGPSGAGKTALSNYLKEKYNIPRVITHTTRPRRVTEKEGESYYFETDKSFKKLHFFEHVRYGNYQYGSSIESLKNSWKDHQFVSLIVETDGVKKYIEKLGEKVYFIYLTVSNYATLQSRLVLRGDKKEEIDKRLNSLEFKRDLVLKKNLKEDAHIIINDDWEDTKEKVDVIIQKLSD